MPTHIKIKKNSEYHVSFFFLFFIITSKVLIYSKKKFKSLTPPSRTAVAHCATHWGTWAAPRATHRAALHRSNRLPY